MHKSHEMVNINHKSALSFTSLVFIEWHIYKCSCTGWYSTWGKSDTTEYKQKRHILYQFLYNKPFTEAQTLFCSQTLTYCRINQYLESSVYTEFSSLLGQTLQSCTNTPTQLLSDVVGSTTVLFSLRFWKACKLVIDILSDLTVLVVCSFRLEKS